MKVQAKGLTKRYGPVVAADNLSFEVFAGEIVGIIGPNGAGKTTTIEMMGGLRRPDAGSCIVCGYDSIRQNRFVRERIGISLQGGSLPPEAAVIELLRLYASIYADPLPVNELLARFRLEDKARAPAGRLSGGQVKRVTLAVAIIGRPEVIFLDEPTTGLDPQSRRHLWDMVRDLKDDGRAVIVSTHYMDEVEQLCDRVLVMDRGTIIAEGRPRDLIARHGPEKVIEVELEQAGAMGGAELEELPGVTEVQSTDDGIIIHTSDTPGSLMGLAGYVRENRIPLGDMRTRSATMDDVFIALTGRSVRE